MKKILILLLATSLTANAWLLVRDFAEVPPASAAPPPAQPIKRTEAPARESSAATLLARVDFTDPIALRDALRTTRFDDSSIRAVLEGMLHRRHREQRVAARIDNYRSGWWRPPGPSGTAAGASQRLSVDEPLRELLGADPLDVADAELRYDFLPAEKKRKLALIDVDYGELLARTPLFARGLGVTKAEQDEQRLLAQERQRDVLAALSPQERTEFELRFGGTAASNSKRFAEMGATEIEFRTIKPIVDALNSEFQTLPSTRDLPAARVELEQRAIDRLVATVGYDRTVEFLWSLPGPYQDVARVLREAALPRANASRLYQLVADTGESAETIHYDGSLNAAQKRAALGQLQASVRPQLDALVPPPVQEKLPADAITWFRGLGEGRYTRMYPMVTSGGRGISSQIAVTSPPVRDERQRAALPRRPVNRAP